MRPRGSREADIRPCWGGADVEVLLARRRPFALRVCVELAFIPLDLPALPEERARAR